MDAGIVLRVLHPMIILVICGTTRPIHPITPEIETEDAMIITAKIKNNIFLINQEMVKLLIVNNLNNLRAPLWTARRLHYSL